ncbi:MAG: chromosome partitioning protein ParB [Candidatus Lumbricidophila eiseniae]|uniref:Chromosome partitioning protein ParB n=1 Tax=Candidatus Lumbricidiphila eiseniae TaxID=1969409 RepID=A0A2A6FRT2_9MICO|nr:MAG: chromosome partitioning protein ParB [Candidatus Lumbricidophila eiseniae]
MATPRRTGLGRGIGALIPGSDDPAREVTRPVDVFFPTSNDSSQSTAATTAASGVSSRGATAESNQPGLVDVPGARLVHLNPDDILPNAQQPRSIFDPDALAELVHSVREFGVMQPIVVRPHPQQPGKYELVMGERRLRASKLAELKTIPAVVKDTANENMLRDALLENLHRSQLNVLEEASAYQQLLADFGITQDELASRIGRSRPQISNTMRLLKLPEDVQMKVAAGVLSAGHARAILAVGDHAKMAAFANTIINQELSVRAAEALVAKAPKVQKAAAVAGKRQDFLDDLAARLGDRLNTRVKVSLGAKKGQIVIDFSTVNDLRRILEELGENLNGL